MIHHLSTEGVRTARQYAHWRDLVGATHEAWDMPRRGTGAFRGWVRRHQLGQAEVLSCACDPCSGRRGREELRKTRRAATGILFVLEGEERLSFGQTDLFVGAGQLAFWDTTHPLSFQLESRLRKLTLILPSDLLHGVPDAGLRAAGRVFDARAPDDGGLLLAQVRALASLEAELSDTMQQAVLRSTLELLAATVSPQLAPATSMSERTVSRAEAEISAHLEDPMLSVEAVAHALGISRRQLDRAFADVGQSAARSIWTQRLERCRRDLLLDPSASISDIAFRWGFSDAAHFSRAFRREFGNSPRIYRGTRGRAR